MFGMMANWGPGGDRPDVGNVLNDDTVAGNAGTYVAASTGDVRKDTTYGAGGTEHTGSLEVTGEVSLFFLRRKP